MSIIEERVEEFLGRAERMLACGLTERFLRMQAKREGVLDYIQIFARARLDSTPDNHEANSEVSGGRGFDTAGSTSAVDHYSG